MGSVDPDFLKSNLAKGEVTLLYAFQEGLSRNAVGITEVAITAPWAEMTT